MPPPRGQQQGGGGWRSFLVPGLFGCLLLGLLLTPAPFLYGGGGVRGDASGGGSSSSSHGHGGGGGGSSGSGVEDELSLLLRGKQTQRAAGVPPVHGGKGGVAAGGQPASTDGLLRYFAEAHRKVRRAFGVLLRVFVGDRKAGDRPAVLIVYVLV